MQLIDGTVFELGGKVTRLNYPAETRILGEWRTAIIKDVAPLRERSPSKLDWAILKGIRDLQKMDIVLKQADKNLGLVPIARQVYRRMVGDHLWDPSTYCKVTCFPRDTLIREMTRLVWSSGKPYYVIRKWLRLADNSEDAKPAPFYAMPKIHKQKLFVSRPVTAQHSYLLAPLSRALAEVLQPTVDNLACIARDSKTMAKELSTLVIKEKDYVFLTYDVVALYPSIDLRDALPLLKANIPVLRERDEFWYRVLRLVMLYNFVSFEDEVYHQIQGTATGTAVAPPFANLYMYFKYKHILDVDYVQFQRRYIDDGLILVDTPEQATQLMWRMSTCCNLRFTWDVNSHKAVFLDLQVHRNGSSTRHLGLRPYFKPTNLFMYLPFNSHHPLPMRVGIIKGEAIRCLRNSTERAYWLAAMDKIFKGLLGRGYPGAVIMREFRKIRWEDRDKYLFAEAPPREKPEGTLICAHYNAQVSTVWRWLTRKHSLPRRLILRGKHYTAVQRDVIEAWPPRPLFYDFHKVGHRLIRARQDTSTPMAGQRQPTTRCPHREDAVHGR